MSSKLAGRPDLIVHSRHPLNAEPPLGRLRAAFITGASDFYIRTHGDLPVIDPGTHQVAVRGRVARPLALTLADLKARFSPKTVTAVLQCAGNRRADLQEVQPTSGDPWEAGAIGNAEWTGVPLADILRAAGAETRPDLHVAFEAVDVAENEDAPDAPYAVSIPMAKALDSDVLVAWAMNGEPLLLEHGAPLRAIVPGFAGVRSAKWLRTITVQDRPSAAVQQCKDYLLYAPDVRKETCDRHEGITIQAMPLNSAICEPQTGAAVPAGRIAVRGYALATDRAITRVDVSPNDGGDWIQATIENHGNQRWSWTLWHALLDIAEGEHVLAVRAWDAAGQTQPSRLSDVWNCKGYLCAAWHRVRVTGV